MRNLLNYSTGACQQSKLLFTLANVAAAAIINNAHRILNTKSEKKKRKNENKQQHAIWI